MKRSKGFTLIELLTVIAILAIVLLISVPVILGVLEKAKKNNFKNQALLYIDSLKKTALMNEIDNTSSSITLPDTGSLRIDVKDIPMDSASDIDGYIVITKNDNGNYTYLLYISNGEYKICNKKHNKIDEKDIEKGDGCEDSLLYPTITNEYSELTYNYKYDITDSLILNGVSATDAIDGNIPTEEITYTGSIDSKTLGTYEITYRVENSLGNYATAKRTIHIKDTTKPEITNVTGNPTNWTTSATLTVEASDNYQLADEKTYSFDDGKTWQAGNSKTFTANKTVKIKVKDKVGNISEVSQVNITRVIGQNASDMGYVTSGLLVLYDGLTSPKNGIWSDLSGNGNDGILNKFDDSNGWDGTSIYLKGTNYISGANNNPLYNGEGSHPDMTVEIVFKKTTGSWANLVNFGQSVNGNYVHMCLWTTITSDSRAYAIHYDYNGSVRGVGKGPRIGWTNYPLGSIVKITYLNSGNTYMTYVNDSKFDTEEINNPQGFTGNRFEIGKANSGYYFTGNVYTVRVYNRALTQSEISKNYMIDKERFGI